MYKNKNLIGQKFNYWEIIQACKWDNSHIICKCVCGKQRKLNLYKLRSGKTKSCGCKIIRNTGKRRKKLYSEYLEYSSWIYMIRSCYPPEGKYSLLEHKKIKVCDSWKGRSGFMTFLKEIGKKQDKNHTLLRVDQKKNFYKENCKWGYATQPKRKTSVSVSYKNKQVFLIDLCKELKLNYCLMYNRVIKNKWSVEDAIITKSNKSNKKLRKYNPTI